MSNNYNKEDTINLLYNKLWKEGLSDIVPEATAKEIASELLIPDKIDGFAFAENYETFLRRGMPSVQEFFCGNEVENHSTTSIKEASKPLNYIPCFPDWFIAAYPDVFLWFSGVQDDRLKNRGDNEDIDDIMMALTCELFGINLEDKELGKDGVYDSNEKWLAKWLKNLVSSYKRETGKKLEASVDETKNNAVKEIYDNPDFVAAMEESGLDNFIIIARKTTMYYLELSKHYRHRFINEARLLATAGVFDAQVYIFMYKNITISEVIELAEKVVEEDVNPLVDFIIGLEIKMFAVDTPELPISAIEESCEEQRDRITEEVEQFRTECKPETFYVNEVRAFMESEQFAQMREQIGINKGAIKKNTGWNFNRLLKTQMALFNRLTFYRKPIMSLKADLTEREKESIEGMIYGFGWMADSDMRKVPETDCISIMVVTPARILIGAGELTTSLEYYGIADCFWIDGDLCLVAKEKEVGIGGIRFQPLSENWPEPRRTSFQQLILSHIEESI